MDDDELVTAYRRCAVFCMPGVAELQSLVTLEAMAAGRPVVAADAVALPHLVRPGHNGLLYRPGDVAGLAAALNRLLDDPAARERMGQASREMVARHALGRDPGRVRGRLRGRPPTGSAGALRHPGDVRRHAAPS